MTQSKALKSDISTAPSGSDRGGKSSSSLPPASELETVELDLKPMDIVMQSTCGAYELLFWRMNVPNAGAATKDAKSKKSANSCQIKSPSIIKDAWWATYTCTFGWPVQVC